MNEKILNKINRALERSKNTDYATYAPVTIETLQKRLSEELDWIDADPGRECLIVLMCELVSEMRRSGVVVNPGYYFFPYSYLFYLAGVTHTNPVDWNLPFICFSNLVYDGAVIPFEAGTGCLEVARKVLSGRENEIVTETKAGLFEITFIDGEELRNVKLRIKTNAKLDKFRRTLKDGWHSLDEATLKLFSRGATEGTIFFESDKMKEWLFEFDPESMSDLVLLNAIQSPGRMQLFEKILAGKRRPDSIPVYEDAAINRALSDSYGVPVYQEQAILLGDKTGYPKFPPFQNLVPKGHFIGCTMIAVEALWPWRNKTKLK